jgi:hypothetical protein
MFVTVGLLYGTQGRRERKENDRESTVLKYITFMQVVDTTMCIESC